MADLYSTCKALDLIINTTLKNYSKNMSNDPIYRKVYIRQMKEKPASGCWRRTDGLENSLRETGVTMLFVVKLKACVLNCVPFALNIMTIRMS